jgi:hypothetical protein
MKSSNRIILTVAILALGVLSCQVLTNLAGGGATATVPPQTSGVLLEDDFTSTTWGTGTDADSAIEYVDEALQMIVFTKNWFVWSPPNNENYENIHMEVTAINNDTDPTTAFGIMCHQQEVADSFYYFAITPAGQYAIAETSPSTSDVFLTNDNQWQYSDSIPRNAQSYRLGADCGNGALTLYVDGQQIDSVTDDTYSNGGVALFVWSGEDVASANVSFDDFIMTRLP